MDVIGALFNSRIYRGLISIILLAGLLFLDGRVDPVSFILRRVLSAFLLMAVIVWMMKGGKGSGLFTWSSIMLFVFFSPDDIATLKIH